MDKRILITGITGFVGSHLAEFALEKKTRVYGLKRWHLSKLRNIHQFKEKLILFDCDITDPVGIQKIVKEIKPDWIFHLAAESFVSPSWNHPSHYMDVNYNGTVNILEAIKQAKLSTRILLAGSGEEYGDISEKDLPITERTPLFPVNPYAVSKIAQDLIGYVYYKSYGLDIIRTRAFNHEGPRRDNVFGIPWYAYQIARIEQGLQEPVIQTGYRNDRRNFTHIKDLIKAYWLAMERCEPGEIYLIGSDEESHIYTFDQALDKLINMSTYKRKIKKEVYSGFVRPTSVPRLIGDTSKFRKLTNWKPEKTFDEILMDTLEYWRDFVKRDLY